MESIGKLALTTVEWKAPHALERSFELSASGHALGTLHFVKAFGSLAEGRTADGAWTFKRGGFLRPHVTIRPAGSEQDIGTFRAGWGGDGELHLTDGFSARLVHTNFWHTRWAFQTPDGRPLLHFTPHDRFFKPGAIVEIDPSGQSDPHLALLVMLGWYLMVMMAQDAAAAGGAAAAVAAG